MEFYQPFGILLPVPHVRPHRLLPPIAGLFAAGILALSASARDLDAPPRYKASASFLYSLADPVAPGGGGTLRIAISNRDEDREPDAIRFAIDLEPAVERRPGHRSASGRDFCPTTATAPCILFPRW